MVFPLWSKSFAQLALLNTVPSHRLVQQIVTDQQTGQKIQIVTALEPASPGKQQFILANADYSPGGKVILTKQEGSPNKVILASPDGSGVNQLLFASPDLAGQQIQVRRTNKL